MSHSVHISGTTFDERRTGSFLAGLKQMAKKDENMQLLSRSDSTTSGH